MKEILLRELHACTVTIDHYLQHEIIDLEDAPNIIKLIDYVFLIITLLRRFN